jgi:hypothetical protein
MTSWTRRTPDNWKSFADDRSFILVDGTIIFSNPNFRIPDTPLNKNYLANLPAQSQFAHDRRTCVNWYIKITLYLCQHKAEIDSGFINLKTIDENNKYNRMGEQRFWFNFLDLRFCFIWAFRKTKIVFTLRPDLSRSKRLLLISCSWFDCAHHECKSFSRCPYLRLSWARYPWLPVPSSRCKHDFSIGVEKD